MNNIIENKLGKTFSPSMVFAGYIFIAFGVLVLSGGLLAGLIPLFMGAFVSFTFGGVKFDIDNKKYLDYSSLFFIKFGKWKTYTDFPYFSVNIKSISTSARSYNTSVSAVTSKDTYYEYYLLDAAKKEKVLFKRITADKFFKEDIRGYVELLEMEFITSQQNRSKSHKRTNRR